MYVLLPYFNKMFNILSAIIHGGVSTFLLTEIFMLEILRQSIFRTIEPHAICQNYVTIIVYTSKKRLTNFSNFIGDTQVLLKFVIILSLKYLGLDFGQMMIKQEKLSFFIPIRLCFDQELIKNIVIQNLYLFL